MVLGEVLLVIT